MDASSSSPVIGDIEEVVFFASHRGDRQLVKKARGDEGEPRVIGPHLREFSALVDEKT